MSNRPRRIVPVTLAAALLAALAGSLMVRARQATAAPGPLPTTFTARGAITAAPAATVPALSPADVSRLEFPCWSCSDARDWPLRSRVDLDLVAPLGDGPGNAAVFFREFSKQSGRRHDELERARKELIETVPGERKVLPPDHPLLLEAEPWTEQATLRFYPDLLHLDGWDTEVPDLVFPLTLAKSWVERGRARGGEAALDDYRRAVRLGRLLRQEDTTIIQDLVGLACVGVGLRAIYDELRDRGDVDGALVAAVALGELAPQRLLTSERVTRLDVTPYLSKHFRKLDLPARQLDAVVAMAESGPDRRFRGEATLQLGIVAHRGGGEERERATRVLEQLGAGEDERIARLADWALTHPPSAEVLRGLAAESR
jgi:hypothetical protein